jgi:hypothetical protein
MTGWANLLPASLGLLVGAIALISTHVAKRNFEARKSERERSRQTSRN